MAEATMLRAFAAKRMPHAWLLTGPQGIGKATLAFRFARWILAGTDRSATHLNLVGHDPVLRMVDSGGHPDLRVLAREINEKTGKLRSEISVNQARAAVDFMRLTPALGGWRIVIVDAADDLSTEASNALLKAIEEPPPRALFLIVAHAISRVIPTVRSRCQRLTLNPLPDAAVIDILVKHVPDLSPADSASVAKLAEGSPGRALALVDAGALASLRDIETLLGALPDLDAGALERLAENAARKGEEAVAVLRDLVLWWIGNKVKEGLGRGASRLDRWARLWEKTRHLFERAEAASLDRKQVLLEIFYDIEAMARAA